MLANLLQRKRHVKKVIEQAQAKRHDLERERRDAKAQLWSLEQERDRLTRTIFDEKARALLTEDRAPIEAEIERLRARQPVVSAEITELTQEIIPRLECHLQEAEKAVKVEALDLRYDAAVRAAQGREALLKRWNATIPDILAEAKAIGTFNGRLEAHQRVYRDAAGEQKQSMRQTGEAIPVSLLHALRVAVGEAWQIGWAKGAAEAHEEEKNL